MLATCATCVMPPMHTVATATPSAAAAVPRTPRLVARHQASARSASARMRTCTLIRTRTSRLPGGSVHAARRTSPEPTRPHWPPFYYARQTVCASDRLAIEIARDIPRYPLIACGDEGRPAPASPSFAGGQHCLPVIQPHRLTPLFPCVTALGQQLVVQPATLLKVIIEEALLLLRRK